MAPAPVADPTTDLDFGGATGAPEQPQATPDDKPFDDEPFDAGVEADEETDPKKFIEQLTGKLGQSLRKYNDAQPQPDFELEKFAINSLLSASHTGEMDAEDQTDIIKKVKSSGNEQDSVDSGEESSEETPENLDGLDGIEDFDGEEKPEEEVEEHILEKKENFFLDKPKRSSIFAPEGSDEFIKQNIIPESDNNKSAKKQFVKDLQSDPDYLKFKEKAKGFGVPSVVNNDPFIKKSKNTRVGKEDEIKDSRRTTENFIVKGKNGIFSKTELKAKLHETFNQEDTETQLVEPAPTKEPEIAPMPTIKPSRRNKPFLPSPSVQPNPKAMNENFGLTFKNMISILDNETFNMSDIKSIALRIKSLNKTLSNEIAFQLAGKYVDLVNNRDAQEKMMESRATKEQYQVYHNSFSSAVQTAEEFAISKGYEIDEREWFNIISTGPKKPDEGVTNRYTIPLYINGKEQRKSLQIQVYGMGNKYELNTYIN